MTKGTQIEIAEDGLPKVGVVRLPQILAVLPFSRSTWIRGIQEGRFPKPIKYGPRTQAWRVEDVREVLEHGAVNVA